MPVFISHRSTDDALAKRVYDRLTRTHLIKCYLDDLDPKAKTTTDITQLILRRLHECSHVLVVLTAYTQESWWVPFEIGVGTEAQHRLATYATRRVMMPDFLTQWPVMETERDLDEFARLYKAASQPLRERRLTANVQDRLADAVGFHRALKSFMGQR